MFINDSPFSVCNMQSVSCERSLFMSIQANYNCMSICSILPYSVIYHKKGVILSVCHRNGVYFLLDDKGLIASHGKGVLIRSY